jgi:5-methylcytosine-specific restriction endonuclease McrA
MVTGGTQHGTGLANSPQPTVCQTESSVVPSPDMDRLGLIGARDYRQEGEPGQQHRMASMGQCKGDSATTVRSEERADLVSMPVSTANVLTLLERQRFRCALTGRLLTPQTAALDHIVPIRCGGGHVIENTQVLHKDVNRAKGSLTNEEFIALCREVARWADGCGQDGG